MSGVLRQVVVEDGTTIAYTVLDGVEPAVVILHGLAGSSREFAPTAHALEGRKVILIDQRGHGDSTTRPPNTSRDAFASDIASVIRAEGLGPVDLVGHSMGAHTAMLVTAKWPNLVRRLVLLEGNQGGGTPEEHAALGDYFRSWPVPFADRAAAAAALGHGPLEQAWLDDLEVKADGLYPKFDASVMQSTNEAVAEPRWAEWESIQTPTLVVYADGGMFTEQEKEEFVQRGRNARRADLKGASHDAHLNAFDQWIKTLSDFLAPSNRAALSERIH